MIKRARGSHGWKEINADDKKAIIASIVSGKAPKGPLHLELDICDRCNVDCYFCNQMDVRTKDMVPYERVVEILDDAVATGLKSVRLAGGGDPLFHRELEKVLDYIHAKNLVIDNITTNGVGLSVPVAERLVAGGMREIVISLNAADAEDYSRMMQVKPAIFDKVVTNVENLVKVRGDAPHPCIIVQFLLDKANYTKLPQMYQLGRRLGADVIAVNLVLEIPRHRVDRSMLLSPAEGEMLRPALHEVISADRDAGLLEICFEYPGLNIMLNEIQQAIGTTVNPGFTTAPSFREENGHCFFGYYSAVVRGNGDMYPCCMLMNPDYKPIANAMAPGAFSAQWRDGAGFTKLRSEEREVLLAGEETEFQEGRFETLMPQCVNAHQCGLKNIFFRHDEDFYRDLGNALEKTREREITFVGNRQQIARALQRFKVRHPKLRRAYDRFVVANPTVKRVVKKYLGVRYSG